MSTLPQFSMHELIEAGAHFGHRTKRWNPKMAPYLFGVRNNIHIIDLQQTVPMLHRALAAVRDCIAARGRVLFVGTKRQASEYIAEAAKRCGQYYVNHRWLGGMLTNWSTVSQSIKRMRQIEERLGDDTLRLTKKERLTMEREYQKLERSLGGIKDMGGLPDMLFVIDTNKEELAVSEARRLGIPVVAIVDSNCDPYNITYPIPGNDDASRSIQLYCRLFSDAVLSGIQDELVKSGVDLGAAVNVNEPAMAMAAAADAVAAPAEASGEGEAKKGARKASGKAAPKEKKEIKVEKKKTPGKKAKEEGEDAA